MMISSCVHRMAQRCCVSRAVVAGRPRSNGRRYKSTISAAAEEPVPKWAQEMQSSLSTLVQNTTLELESKLVKSTASLAGLMAVFFTISMGATQAAISGQNSKIDGQNAMIGAQNAMIGDVPRTP